MNGTSYRAARLIAAGCLLAVAATVRAQDIENRRLVQMRVIHASSTVVVARPVVEQLDPKLKREVWVDPSLDLIRTKLTRFPYSSYTLLQDITQALALHERGAVMLPDHGGSVEVVPTAFLGPRMRMQVRVVPTVTTNPVELAAETNPAGTLVIGGVPHAGGTLLILIQQLETRAAPRRAQGNAFTPSRQQY